MLPSPVDRCELSARLPLLTVTSPLLPRMLSTPLMPSTVIFPAATPTLSTNVAGPVLDGTRFGGSATVTSTESVLLCNKPWLAGRVTLTTSELVVSLGLLVVGVEVVGTVAHDEG